MSYVIGNDFVNIYNDKVKHNYRWDEINRIARTKDFFIIYTAKNCRYFIPKRYMDNDKIETLRRLSINNLAREKVFI